jgi:gas vesicle protein
MDIEEISTMERNGSSSVLWFVSGAIIGTAAAVLLAPDSGERMREKLVSQFREGGDWSASGRELFERGRELYLRGCEIVEEAAELFEQGRNLAEKKIEG